MADQIQAELIVTAVAKGFEQMGNAINANTKAMREEETATRKANDAIKAQEAAARKLQQQQEGNRRAMKDMGEAGKMAFEIIGKGLDYAVAASERLGRTDMPDALDNASEAAQRLGDSLLEMPIGDVLKQMPAFAAVAKLTGSTALEGADALDILAKGLQGAADAANLATAVWIKYQLETGQISQEEAIRQVEQLTEAVQDNETAAQKAEKSVSAYGQRWKGLAEDMTAGNGAAAMAAQYFRDIDQAAEDMAAADKTRDLRDAADAAALGMRDLTEAVIYSHIAKTLDAEAALRMGVALGQVDKENAELILSLAETRNQYDLNKDGYIDATEAANGYTQSVIEQTNAFTGQLAAMREISAELANQPGGDNGTVGGAIGDGYAAGGSMVVPPGFPNDSAMIRVQSGERVTVETPGQQTAARGMGGGMGGGYQFGDVNIYAQPGQDGAALFAEFNAAVSAQIRARRAAGD